MADCGSCVSRSHRNNHQPAESAATGTCRQPIPTSTRRSWWERCTTSSDGLVAADPDPEVRAGVAINPSAGSGLLEQLSRDPSNLVRSCAAQNPATPAAALAVLAGDADSRVRLAALANPATPAGPAPGEAAASHPDPAHRAARNVTSLTTVASDPATTGDVLDALAAHRDAAVRSAVAANPNTAPATLLTLTADTRPDIADAARAALAAVLAATEPQPAAPRFVSPSRS